MNDLRKSISILLFFVVFIFVFLGQFGAANSQQRSVIESLSLLLILASSIVFAITNYNAFLSISSFDLVCLIFIVYLCIKAWISQTSYPALINYLACLSLFYFLLKSHLLNNKGYIHLVLLTATVLILVGYIIFASFLCQKDTMGRLPNKSISSILLASQIVLTLPLIVYFRTATPSFKPLYWPLVCFVIASVVLLALTNGRAGWFGFIISITYILYRHLTSRSIRKIIRFGVFPLGIMLFILLFFYKPDSSSGRLLIYKISAGMLADNWLWGVGTGKFKVVYNQYQAAYFEKNSIDSKEALLADNTFYAFNDFFQVIIENGCIGALFGLAIIILLIQRIRKTIVTHENSHLFTAVTASLICLLTGSSISYPLQTLPAAFQTIVALAVLNAFPADNNTELLYPRQVFICLPVGIFFVFQTWVYYFFSQRALSAYNLERTGFTKEALAQYKLLEGEGITEGNVLYEYAQILYHTNQPAAAHAVLTRAEQYYCAANLYTLSGRVAFELQHYLQAEKDYRTAVFMVPNKMMNRFNLLNYYIERKDTSNIIFWSNSILNMRVKVPGSIARNIQQNVKSVLLRYESMP